MGVLLCDILGFLSAATASGAVTTEAPPRPTGRQGRIPTRVLALGTVSVPLCLRAKASPFWIILLLVWADANGAKDKKTADVLTQKMRGLEKQFGP
jgi:hypothetical protein